MAHDQITRIDWTYYYPLNTLDYPEPWVDPQKVSIEGLGLRLWPVRLISAVKMEGTVLTPDGVVNFDGKRFYLLDPDKFPYGQGAYGNALVPFRSVAVDPTLIPLKSTLLVKELQGRTMPNGIVHDGLVKAADTGGRIRGAHLDFFVRGKMDCVTLERVMPSHTMVTGEVRS